MSRAAILGSSPAHIGWAVRFVLGGWDVAIWTEQRAPFEARLRDVQRHREGAPEHGALIPCDAVQDAIHGADWIMSEAALPEDAISPGAIRVGEGGSLGLAGIDPIELIPVVEVWGDDARRALPILTQIGMTPVLGPGGIVGALRHVVSETARRLVMDGASPEAVATVLGQGLAYHWAMAGTARDQDPEARLTRLLNAGRD